MRTVTAREFKQNTGKYQDLALSGPVTITKHDRPTYVLLSFEDYQRLTGENKRALHVTELSQEAISALGKAVMDEKHNHLNSLLED